MCIRDRLYTLREEIVETHTLDRLQALVAADILPAASGHEIAEAYEFLMKLRLRQQLGALQAGQFPDNRIDYRRGGQLQHTMLNQYFAQVTAIQKRIGYDFLGGMT